MSQEERLEAIPTGWLAAGSLLAVACFNPSLTGSVFLLFFLTWATVALPSIHSPRGATASKALWRTAAAAVGIALALQISVQLAFLARAPGIRKHAVAKTLEILGFSRIETGSDFLTQLVLLAVTFALLTHQATLVSTRRRRRRPAPDHVHQQQHIHRPHVLLSRSNLSFLAAISMLGISFLRPALVSLPYAIALFSAAFLWADSEHPITQQNLRKSQKWVMALQTYAAGHLTAIYVWQWALFYAAPLRALADYLGIFILDYKKQSIVEFTEEIAVCGCLAVLITVVAYLRSQENPLGRIEVSRHREQNEEYTDPLLAENTSISVISEQQHIEIPNKSLFYVAWNALFSHSGSVAAVVCGVALLRPSILGAVLLIGSMLTLVNFPRKRGISIDGSTTTNTTNTRSDRALHALLWSLYLWFIACYIATALQSPFSSWSDAVGVHVFSNGSPLFAIFLSIVAVATYIHTLQRPDATVTTTITTTTSAAAFSISFHNFRAVQALDMVMVCVVPATVFTVGVASYDVIHILLLIGLVLAFLTTTLRLKPTLIYVDPGLGSTRHQGAGVQFLRVFSAVVVLAMYVVSLATLDIFQDVFNPVKYQGILQILGLWNVNGVEMLSFAALLALAAGYIVLADAATTAPSLGENTDAPREDMQEYQIPRVNGVPTWRSRWQLLLARKTSTYGAVVVASVLYCLVLLNCDVSFLGVAYMVVAVWCLALQPQKGQWRVLADNVDDNEESIVLNSIIRGATRFSPLLSASSADSGRGLCLTLVGSSLSSWIPLLSTVIVATLDFVLQITLPALAANFDIPDDVLNFMKTAVGVDFAPTGHELALRLLRPTIVLASVYAFRRLYSIGILHRQLAHAALSDDEYEQHRLAKQWSFGAFVKRCLILHASKVVVVVAFAAAMQDPSALGWALVVGLVLIPPFLYPTNRSNTSNPTALRAALIAVYCVASVWLLAQYTIQISWIKSLLSSSTLPLETQDLLSWLGIVCSSAEGGSPSPSLLEHLLRWKALLLAAVALNQKVLIWWTKLPEVVRNEAKCGAKCPLFWPPTPTYPHPIVSTTLDSSAPAEARFTEESELSLGPLSRGSDEEPAIETDAIAQPLNTARVALHHVAQKARTLAQQALTAVDWPASPRPSTAATDVNAEEKEEETPSPLVEQEIPTISTTSNQLIAFRFALQDWAERCYDDWGLEIALFTLLVAAFIAANALSLIYLAAVAIGMVVPSKPRRVLWMWMVLPVLGVILLWQYSELVGLPPTFEQPPLTEDTLASSLFFNWDPASPLAEDVKAWLGLTDVDPVAVWALFVAYGATVLQMYCDRGRSSSSSTSCGRTRHAYSTNAAEDSTLVLPLLNNNRNTTTTTTAAGLQAESSFFESPYAAELWAPLEYSAQHRWKWHDWIRYTVYRRSLDFLLVAVVALCTLDNDIIHAGYLALALFFFRSRVALRARRNSLFAWLPLYNFAVMAIVLAYQAPFEDVWDWPLDDGTSCTLAHLLGLYKLHSSSSPLPPPSPSLPPAAAGSASLLRSSSRSSLLLTERSSLLSWGYEGSIADLILWVFIRLQSHLFASPTYRQVVAVAEAEESQERAARKDEVAEWKHSQAAAAIEESGQRAARALRISRIKEGVNRNLNLLFGGGGGTGGKEEDSSGGTTSHLGGSALDFDFLDIGTGGKRRNGGDEESSASTSATINQRDPQQQGLEKQKKKAPPRPSVAMLTEYERTMARISEIEAEAQDSISGGEIFKTNKGDESISIPSSYLETEKEKQPQQGKEQDGELGSGEEGPTKKFSWIGSVWRWFNTFLPRRADRRESALAYTLFVFAYLSDLSLLTMVLPLSAFVYALVAVRPARVYWHGVLIYCEVIIVASYAFQVPSRLDCGFISTHLQRTAEMLGIHSNAARCIPLFFVYLATLRHTHGLLTRHAAGQRAAAAEEEALPGTTARDSFQQTSMAQQVDLERGNGNGNGGDIDEVIEVVEDFDEPEEESMEQRLNGDSGDAAAAAAIGSTSRPRLSFLGTEEASWVSRSIEALSISAAGVCEFILTACAAQCERSPSFLLVELQKGVGDSSTGADIETALQAVLDAQRARDLAAERFKRRESSSNISSESWEGLVMPSGRVITTSSSRSLASMGPIKLRFHSFLDESVLPPKLLPEQQEKEARKDAVDFGAKEEKGDGSQKKDESKSQPTTSIHVLLEVIPLQCTPQNTPGVCTTPGWPLRSLRPAATAATVLLSSKTGTQQTQVDNLKVLSAEPHGRQARDFYALTAVLDILAFIFVAVFYNKVVHAAGSLSEITSQHVVPLGYLLTLMTLFMFMVMDRVVYTLGNAAGKVALHLAEMTLFFWYCSSLVWDPPGYYYNSATSSGASSSHAGDSVVPRDHLRVLLALKSASFAFSALQLRTGYPPPASYANGMGRHTFIFMRSVSFPASLAFHAFTAVPFLYEMRQLLDWACTATTLTLYDWLKLEDINMSLYFAAVMRASRAQKPHGMRQPRYLKFFQGTLLFSLLLILLWVPLLVFSTGNPTYQVPSLASFSVNVTLQASSAEQGMRLSSPLFRGGDRGTWRQWIKNEPDTLPPALAADYAPEQLQLLCTPPDADSLWSASPPARQALTFVLESKDADVAISFGWNVQRDLPPPSEHGGPQCAGTAAIALAKESHMALLQVLQGEATSAPLLRKSSFSPSADFPQDQENSTSALFPAFWLMRGDACTARPLQDEDLQGAREALPSRKRRVPTDLEWADRWLACNASLETTNANARNDGGDRGVPIGEVWWRLVCGIVDSQGTAIPEKKENTENDDDPSTSWPITCPSSPSSLSSSSSLFTGPRIVVLVDRVQGGIIGATINKFGVVGLYTVFVYGIGRFLRLSVTNLRMRIPFEDLPTTRRLVALCQDIYIARAEGLLGLEEELYGALITVYRLPHVLFALTKKNK